MLKVDASDARVILSKYFGDDIIMLLLPVSSWSVKNGRYQAIFANYHGMKGYDPLVAVSVHDLHTERTVERFNII